MAPLSRILTLVDQILVYVSNRCTCTGLLYRENRVAQACRSKCLCRQAMGVNRARRCRRVGCRIDWRPDVACGVTSANGIYCEDGRFALPRWVSMETETIGVLLPY